MKKLEKQDKMRQENRSPDRRRKTKRRQDKTRQEPNKNLSEIDGGTPPTTAVAMYNRFLRSIDNRLRIHYLYVLKKMNFV